MGGWTPVPEAPASTGGWTPVQEATSAPAAVAPAPEQSFTQKLFDPSYKQENPELFGSPLAGHIAQSFDIYNVAKNLKDGAFGVAQFAHDLGKDLVQNPNWAMGQHSVYEKYISDPASAEFQKSILAGRAGKYSEAAGHGLAGALPLVGPFAAALGEQAGTGDVGGAASKGLGAYVGAKAMEMAAKAPSEVYTTARDFANRSNSLDAISTTASAVHKQAIQHIQTTIESLKAEGIRTIQDAVQADQAASKATGMRGTISSTPIVTEGMKAMEDVGYQAVPKNIQAAIARVAAGPTNLTLEEAVRLRTAFGDAAAKAQGNPKAYYVLNAAREELNPLIEKRFGELGQAKAWTYYNKKFTAAYDIQNGFSKTLESSGNRFESVGKMEDFSKQNLTELQREMKNQGMTQQAKQLDTIKADAQRITEAHGILSKKMGQSMFKMAITDPKAAGLGIAAAVAIHPVAGIGGYLLGTMLSNAMRRVEASMDVGRLGKEYPDAMPTVTDSGPKQNFKFTPPPPGAAPKSTVDVAPKPGEPGSGTVEGAKAANKFFAEAKAKLGPDASLSQVAQEAARMEAMSKRGMPYKESSASKAETLNRIKQANRGPVTEDEMEMERRRPTGGPSSPRPTGTKLSLEDWEKDKKAQEMLERRGEKKKKLDLGKGHPGMDE